MIRRLPPSTIPPSTSVAHLLSLVPTDSYAIRASPSRPCSQFSRRASKHRLVVSCSPVKAACQVLVTLVTLDLTPVRTRPT